MREKKAEGGPKMILGWGCLAAGAVLETAAAADGAGAWALWSGLILLVLGFYFAVKSVQSREKQLHREINGLRSDLEEEKEACARQVRQSKEAAGKEIEDFRSALAHSLRMPVAIIQGYAELLAGDVTTDPEVRRDYLEKIIKRTQDMTAVLGRQFAQGGLKRSNLNFARVDLLRLVRQTAEDMRTAAGERGVRIQVVSKEETLQAQADEYLISRVLFNLIENALKYMGRPGTVSIRVQQEGSNAVLSLQDDGFGLAEEEVEHIFELNYQGSNRASGQGYGLYMVKQIVEAHGGTVSAKSKLGKGLGVHITLPLVQREEEAGGKKEPTAAER